MMRAIVLSALLLVAGCGSDVSGPSSALVLTAPVVLSHSLPIDLGTSGPLSALLKSSTGSSVDVTRQATYVSRHPERITVNAAGTITAVAEGSAYIVATVT